jgi:transcriptional regulator with XRE-family HTH domain
MSSFPERLVELRKSRSLTQKQLAEAIGAHERGIRFYEAGKKQPTLDSLMKLADYFDVSIDYLVGRSDDPSPPQRRD